MSKTDCEADGWHVANDDTLTCDVTWCQYYELTNGTCVTEEECKYTYSGYLYEASTPKKCMTKTECTAETDYYVDDTDKKCVSKTDCQEYKYIFGEGENKACLTYTQCTTEGGDPNFDDHTCDMTCYWITGGDCVTAEECKTTHGRFILKTDKTCLTEQECADMTNLSMSYEAA